MRRPEPVIDQSFLKDLNLLSTQQPKVKQSKSNSLSLRSRSEPASIAGPSLVITKDLACPRPLLRMLPWNLHPDLCIFLARYGVFTLHIGSAPKQAQFSVAGRDQLFADVIASESTALGTAPKWCSTMAFQETYLQHACYGELHGDDMSFSTIWPQYAHTAAQHALFGVPCASLVACFITSAL